MAFYEHLKTFAGMPVRTYNPRRHRKPPARPCVWRIAAYDWTEDEETDFSELFTRFLEDHGGRKPTALVIGAWDAEMIRGAGEVVEALVAARDRLGNLKSLF